MTKAKCIMIQGTGSSVGKSLITAGFCRIFKQDGYLVAPFKSQNMALNSFVTKDGKEMGRAQVVQAEAACLEPDVNMNPILLKPTTDKKAQVILNGEVYGNLNAKEYHDFKPKLAKLVQNAYETLAYENEIIVIEGAGSPAEINLRDKDIVNMGMAEMADAPVILVGDIDKGGVFASLAGTMLLLTEEERARVKGVIINKFRGDLEILLPGLKMLEDIIKIPVLGVIPYTKLNIEEEDSLADHFQTRSQEIQTEDEIDIAIIQFPHMSNATDFHALENIPGAKIRYVQALHELKNPDALILPGTKSSMEDLLYIRNSGLEEAIKQLHAENIPIFGICGGFQMLGMEISDPFHAESTIDSVKGMGLLNIRTAFQKEKVTTQMEAVICKSEGLLSGLEGIVVRGYEIHMGETICMEGCIPLMKRKTCRGEEENLEIGIHNASGSVFGTYLHGIFDSGLFALGFVNNLRRLKGMDRIEAKKVDFEEFKNTQYDLLAELIREHVDMKKIYAIVDGGANR